MQVRRDASESQDRAPSSPPLVAVRAFSPSGIPVVCRNRASEACNRCCAAALRRLTSSEYAGIYPLAVFRQQRPTTSQNRSYRRCTPDFALDLCLDPSIDGTES